MDDKNLNNTKTWIDRLGIPVAEDLLCEPDDKVNSDGKVAAPLTPLELTK